MAREPLIGSEPTTGRGAGGPDPAFYRRERAAKSVITPIPNRAMLDGSGTGAPSRVRLVSAKSTKSPTVYLSNPVKSAVLPRGFADVS